MNLFDTSGFPARWFCGPAWAEEPWIGWLHICSDIVIFAAYAAVPIVVMYFVRQRDDLKFPPIFFGFLAMIFFSCGTVHLIEAVIFWWPIYKVSGIAKLITAVVSATGVVVLARVLPTALDLKSGAAYAEVVEQRRKAQESLKYEQYLLRTMMANLPDLIYFKDRDSRFTRVSDSLATFLGSDSTADVIGKTDRDFFPPEFAAVARADEIRLMETGIPVIGKEEPEHSAQGEDVWLSSTKLPLRDESGEVVGMFGLSRDITPQKRAAEVMTEAKEVAEAASQAKGEFLANMSHEIRTPMNAIMGMTELLLDTELTPVQKEYLDIVYGSAESLLYVINEILDFSKIEAGKLELCPANVDLHDEVGDILQSLALRAHGKGLELAWQVQPDVPQYVKIDPVRLRQILVNLVGNAIKFTPRGEVVVHLSLERALQDSSVLHFTVSDTGIGIEKEKLKLIFDAFSQADSSTTRQFEGTGLGLAITKRVIEAMNGRIWVESEPSHGSRFHFIVELDRGQAPAVRPSLADLDLQQVRVVVVDDNATNLRVLQQTLQSWKMDVRAASDGPGAIEALRQSLESGRQPPLLISDLEMPEMDGFALAARIRSIDELRETAIIVLTSGGHTGDVERFVGLNIAARVMKPVKPSDLRRAIVRVIGRLSQAPSQRKPVAADDSSVRSLRILLAEDGYANQKLATALLEKWGHRVTLAQNGQQAIDLWNSDTFDLILMDVQMPIMDGLQATRLIRSAEQQHGTGKHIPIVAITARAMKGDRQKCLDAGMDGYLSKPIRRNELYQAIRPLFPEAQQTQLESCDEIESSIPVESDSPPGLVDWRLVLPDAADAPEVLASVIDASLGELPLLTTNLQRGLMDTDAIAVGRCAHTIKSIARIYGIEPLLQCSMAMEQQAEAKELEAIREKLPQLLGLVDQTIVELKAKYDAIRMSK